MKCVSVTLVYWPEFSLDKCLESEIWAWPIAPATHFQFLPDPLAKFSLFEELGYWWDCRFMVIPAPLPLRPQSIRCQTHAAPVPLRPQYPSGPRSIRPHILFTMLWHLQLPTMSHASPLLISWSRIDWGRINQWGRIDLLHGLEVAWDWGCMGLGSDQPTCTVLPRLSSWSLRS